MSDVPEAFMKTARTLSENVEWLDYTHRALEIARALMAAAKEADEAATKRERERAIEIMEDNGLVATEYGFICHDEWEAEDEVGHEDEEGNYVLVRPAIEAGDKYGFRMDELLAFIAAGFEARLSALEEK